MNPFHLALDFAAWLLSRIVWILFSRTSYVLLNILVLAAGIWYHLMIPYFLIGIIIAPFLASIDFKRQKIVMERVLGKSCGWHYYLPFFIFDVIFWVYSVLGITGDVIFGHIDRDIAGEND